MRQAELTDCGQRREESLAVERMTATVEEQNPLERKNGSSDSVKKQVLQKGGCDGSHNPG
jgi:hypothetical protein